MSGEITEPHRKTSFTSTSMNTGWTQHEQTAEKAHLLRCAQSPRSNVLHKVRLRSSIFRAPCN
jgi:hypothetical protein